MTWESDCEEAWREVDNLKAQVAALEVDRRIHLNLLGRCNRELRSVLASINAEQYHHDGDDFHELLRDLDQSLKP